MCAIYVCVSNYVGMVRMLFVGLVLCVLFVHVFLGFWAWCERCPFDLCGVKRGRKKSG